MFGMWGGNGGQVKCISNVDQGQVEKIKEMETSLEQIKETIVGPQKNLDAWKNVASLSRMIQDLKSNHMVLSNDIRQLHELSFPQTDLSSALLSLVKKYEILKKKYIEENSERKRLYNEVIELRGNIRVFCRCRPLSPEENANGSSSVFEFDPSQESEFHIVCTDSSKKQFKFDHVFNPQESQETVFAQTEPVVTSVLDGFNVCVFAYGQTGSGKTFTMEGTQENRGVNYRTLEKLFHLSGERNATLRYEFYLSMLEVYNEKIKDLLVENPQDQPSKKLEVKQAPEGTHEVQGLIEARVHGTDEVWELLRKGGHARAVGCTNANELSSRSHCLVRVTVKGENLLNGQKNKSHLWLVDLAGSERVGKIDAEGERLKESQFINRSLSALGDVISALATKAQHIPYRNSKLTHLLQSSLGGDCKTLMFVQISPSSSDLGETLCSLNFATRVRGIEHGPIRKQIDPVESFKYKQMMEKHKQDEKEVKKMQDNMHLLQSKFNVKEQLCKTLQEKVKELESQLADERKRRVKQERISISREEKVLSENKPPLFPSKIRTELSNITNILPLPPRPNVCHADRVKASAPKLSVKEDNGSIIPRLKARRISLVSTMKPQPTQTRRRISIAVQSECLAVSKPVTNNGAQRPKRRMTLLRSPRRSMLFSPLPRASSSTMTPRAMVDRFSSPPPMPTAWKPNLPTVISPRQSRFLSSPSFNLRPLKNAHALNKFRMSVQKKVSNTSPSPHLPTVSDAFLSQFRPNRESSFKLGSARRILTNPGKRRASIQTFLA